jgi:ketosteroid isomerase-like protein
LIDRLEHAETTKDIHLIDHLFIDDAWIILPDGLPVVGKEAILSLYEYIWSRSEIKTIAYHVESTASTSNLIIESGYSISIKADGKENRTMYRATFLASGKEYKISKLEFGEKIISEYKLPKLLEPTGKYHVGQSIHFYEKSSTDQNRVLAFQIWYPANTYGKEYLKYQNQDVVKASGQFLGWPLFFNSYFPIADLPGHVLGKLASHA